MTCSDPQPDLPYSPDEMKCPEVIGITVLSLWEGYTDILSILAWTHILREVSFASNQERI